jgi:hypothetical protein
MVENGNTEYYTAAALQVSSAIFGETYEHKSDAAVCYWTNFYIYLDGQIQTCLSWRPPPPKRSLLILSPWSQPPQILKKDDQKYHHLSKVCGNVNKNPYIINQNHIFSKNYYEVISGYILTNVTPKHSELFIFWLFICSLCCYEWLICICLYKDVYLEWKHFAYSLLKASFLFIFGWANTNLFIMEATSCKTVSFNFVPLAPTPANLLKLCSFQHGKCKKEAELVGEGNVDVGQRWTTERVVSL